MKSKRKILIITAVALLVGILSAFLLLKPATPKDEGHVIVVTDQSFFSDYEVEGNAVRIRCQITLRNTGNKAQVVKLYASFPDDVKNGLLKKEELCAYDLSGEISDFSIGADATEAFEVVFVGEFGGTDQKNDRLLPEIKIVAEADYRTDIEPILNRFPMLQEIDQAYWKSATIGRSSIGPTNYSMAGFAVLSASAKEELENQYSFSKQTEPVLPEGMDSVVTGFSEFEWYLNEDFSKDMLGGSFVGTVCYDRLNGVVFLDVQNA